MMPEPTLTQSADRALCLMLLRHFKDMPDSLFSVHDATSFWPQQQPPDCPRCIGLHAAEAIDARIYFPSFSENYFFAFEDGRRAIAQPAGRNQAESAALLTKHGAPPKPYDYQPWANHPFDVLKGAFEEALGRHLTV